MSQIKSPTTFQVILSLSKKMLVEGTSMRWRMVLGIALELAGVILGILGPYFLKSLIDAFATDAAVATILTLVGLFVISWSGASILSTIRSVFSTKVIDQITEDMATSALRGKLPESARTKTSDTGGTLGLLERLPYSLSIVVDGLIWRTIPIALQLLGSLWLVCALIPFQYALILALVLVGYVLTTWLTTKRHKRISTGANLAVGALSRETGDILRNARRVVFNGALDLEISNLHNLFRRKTTANNKMMWSLVGMVAWQYSVVGIGLLALLSLGTIDVLANRMTVGDFVLLQAYALRLAAPLSGIGFVLSQSAVAIANIHDVRVMVKQAEQYDEAGVVGEGPARIVLDDVSFSYTPGEPTLQNVSLDIEPGSFVVIAGPNGSGKSTLAQIIAGIRTPDDGQVLIDGKNLNYIAPSERHRHVLYVPQFIGLFNRTIGENGLYPPTKIDGAQLLNVLAKWKFLADGRKTDLEATTGEQGVRCANNCNKFDASAPSAPSDQTLEYCDGVVSRLDLPQN